MSTRRAIPARVSGAILAAVLLSLAACANDPEDQVFDLEGSGRVVGFLFRDNDINGVLNQNADDGLPGELVMLRARGESTDFTMERTDTVGFFAFRFAPFGTYRVLGSVELLGDSLEAVPGSDADFVLGANDTVFINFGVRYKTVTVTEARALPVGARRWVMGIVLNPQQAFGDSTVHMTDSTSAIRATGVRPVGLSIGDSVRFLGRRETRDGQPVIVVTTIATRGSGPVPPPAVITAAMAVGADGGTRDAALVRIEAATITDTATVNGFRILTVDDGTGPLEVVLSPTINFNPLNAYVPNVVLDVTGLLTPVAGGGGGWFLRPRGRFDLLVVN